MANQTGIVIVVRAFLPVGKSLDEQFAALSAVKTAHETGDYATLLKLAIVDDVKTEQKTRRVEDATLPGLPAAGEQSPEPSTGEAGQGEPEPFVVADLEPKPDAQPEPDPAPADDADVPAFLKGKRTPKHEAA